MKRRDQLLVCAFVVFMVRIYTGLQRVDEVESLTRNLSHGKPNVSVHRESPTTMMRSHSTRRQQSQPQEVVSTRTQPRESSYVQKTPEVTLVGLISMQRSSSTYLARDILGNQTCWVTLNEILQPIRRQSGDAWVEWPGTLLRRGGREALDSNPGHLFAKLIAETGRRRCLEKWAKLDDANGNDSSTPTTRDQCRDHCYVTWKQFPHKLSLETHPKIWHALQRRYRFHMLILERDISQRWRSFWYAQHTNDWNTAGDKKHKDALAALAVPPIADDFRAQHEAWYQMIQKFVSSPDAPHSMRLNYNEVTGKTMDEMRTIIWDFLHTSVHLSKNIM